MKKLVHAIALTAVASALVPITAAHAERAARGAVAVPVEYQANDRAHAQLVARFRDIRNLSRIKLDLAFDLDATTINGGGRPKVLKRTISYGTDSAARLEEVPCLTDRVFDLNYTGAHYFSLKLFENYEYVRLRLYPGDKTRFPRNDVSCVHDAAAPGGKRFRIMGEYLAIAVPTQQGIVVQLRPVD
jgi:hypothetical protein